MRVALVAPLAESVPPKLYGGTERVVAWLADELVALGHKVTLFASRGSRTLAELVECAPQSLRLAGIPDHVGSTLAMLREVRRRAAGFDVLHFHIDLLAQALFNDLAHKSVVTLHGRLDLPDCNPFYEAYPEMPLISVSEAQRAPMPPNANWLATIHHGLGPHVCPFKPALGNYLAFLGRISPEKRPDRAIEIAKRAGIPLKLAAKVDAADAVYFKAKIEPLLDHPLIDFIGEINDQQKCEFLGNALALLFPIDWPEPFGLVMIESMSAGTPVIAWHNGSVPEIITSGVSGVIVDSVEAAVEATRQARAMDRRRVRAEFERRFTVRRMAQDYVTAYRRLLDQSSVQNFLSEPTSISQGMRLEEERELSPSLRAKVPEAASVALRDGIKAPAGA